MSDSMKQLVAIAAISLAVSACADLLSTSERAPELSPAFQTIPVGFSANSNSFDPRGDAGVPFYPEALAAFGGPNFHQGGGSGSGGGSGPGPNRHRHDGFGEGGLRGLLMGGGLGPDFIGAVGFGHGRGGGRGPFGHFDLPESCAFSETTGRVTCPEFTRHDLTVNVSFAFTDAEGNAQPAFDLETTNTVNVQTNVSGTKSRHDGAVNSTVSHTSDRTVSGLAPGSTERTVNGTAEAHESTVGVRDGVSFSAVRDASDTTNGLVIPLADGRPTIPRAGKVIRNMTISITPEGGSATTRSRREEITFDGTNTISVVITQDGVTHNCTITVPGGRLVCE